MKPKKRILWLLMTLYLLWQIPLPALAVTPQGATAAITQEESIQTVVEQLQQTYGLDESNFSLCYYNTVTGERYSFNSDAWMIAASTYKLPLNMYYYEQEASGQIDSEATIAGHTLTDIHYQSIVFSDNVLSEALLHNLGSFRTYKQLMFDCYGHLEADQIDDITWTKNYYTTGFMMDTLEYLYRHADLFAELLDYLKQAAPESYFKKYVSEYEIAHKYGSYDTAENDVGIIFTQEPYLLAVYTYGLTNGEDVVGRVNEAICQYNTTHYQPSDIAVAEPEAEPASPLSTPENLQIPLSAPVTEDATAQDTPACMNSSRQQFDALYDLLIFFSESPGFLVAGIGILLAVFIPAISLLLHRRRQQKAHATQI